MSYAVIGMNRSDDGDMLNDVIMVLGVTNTEYTAVMFAEAVYEKTKIPTAIRDVKTGNIIRTFG